MKYLFSLVLLFIQFCVLAQTGTSSSPFTSLSQATSVSAAGIYYFNLNGTSFSTYVNSNGWIQVAFDYGDGQGNLTQTYNLAAPGGTSTRGILHSTVLSKFTSIAIVGISSSSGNINATTTNSSILGRIASFTPLHRGTNDNSINNSWTGTGSARLTVNATCPSPTFVDKLNESIFHCCGATTGFT